MIYIAYNFDGLIVSIVKAKSKEIAMVYWQGKGVDYDIIESERDFPEPNKDGVLVIPILTTKKKNLGDIFKPKYIVEVIK
jgi:hypothetical protein